MTEKSADAIREAIEANRNYATALNTITAPSWVSGQVYRSTSSILWSCILTLAACVFTALHLNVSARKTPLARLGQKLKWVALALFAPEIVLYLALSQWLEARWLSKELQKLQKQDDSADQSFVFDMRYGFFVLMGGLHVSLRDILGDQSEDVNKAASRSGLFHSRKVLSPDKVLSSQGVVDLARKGHFIYVSRESIDDRSKANPVQKCLVLAQVTWMVMQCIARKAAGLPVALLEVHTMVHVVCAILMYLFWWEKPLDIQVHETVETQPIHHLLTLMLFEYYKPDHLQFILHPVTASNHVVKVISVDESGQVQVSTDLEGNDELVATMDKESISSSQSTVQLGSADILPCGLGLRPRRTTSESPLLLSWTDYMFLLQVVQSIEVLDGGPISAASILTDRVRKKEIGSREQNFYRFLESDRSGTPFQAQSNLAEVFDPSVVDGAGVHWSGKSIDKVVGIFNGRSVLSLLVGILPLVYGGIHLSVWHFEFPSETESLLWKISCFVIIGSFPTFLSLVFAVGVLSSSNFVIGLLALGLFPCLFLPYVASRIYIVVEAFISLRCVPIGTYLIPQWLQMIPHV